MRRSQGFTLIELMIVVVIAAILAAIALPAYERQVQSSRHAAAKAALADVTAMEEKYYATNNAYSNDLSSLGYSGVVSSGCGGGASACLQIPSAGEYYYSVSVTTSNSGADFTAAAAPVGAQANDPCATFQVTDQGDRSVTGSGSCW